MTDPHASILQAEPGAKETPVARLTITITYLAPLKGQKTSKVRVETSGEVVKSQISDYSNQWTVWDGEEDGPIGKPLADGVLSDIEEPLREWATSAEDAQCRIWRAELSHRLLTELASSPTGARESEIRRILSDLEGPVVPRSKPTPACRKLLATLDLAQVEHAAWSVVRHAQKTGDIPAEAELVDQILTAVCEDMKAGTA